MAIRGSARACTAALWSPPTTSARATTSTASGGIFSRPAHRLYGQSYVGKILVLNAAKGGVATSWMLAEMASRQRAPLALLLNFANPIMAQAAAFSGIPLIDRFERDITQAVRTGQQIELDPAAGLVRWSS